MNNGFIFCNGNFPDFIREVFIKELENIRNVSERPSLFWKTKAISSVCIYCRAILRIRVLQLVQFCFQGFSHIFFPLWNHSRKGRIESGSSRRIKKKRCFSGGHISSPCFLFLLQYNLKQDVSSVFHQFIKLCITCNTMQEQENP